MSYYCMAACGTIGLANQKCNYKCSKCQVKCEGKYASSLKASIGKEAFKCVCTLQLQSSNNSISVSEHVKNTYIPSANENKRICLTV